ncbi:MAG: hypothetical protein ACLQC0_04100 [Thermoplasmata archaeon]
MFLDPLALESTSRPTAEEPMELVNRVDPTSPSRRPTLRVEKEAVENVPGGVVHRLTGQIATPTGATTPRT